MSLRASSLHLQHELPSSGAFDHLQRGFVGHALEGLSVNGENFILDPQLAVLSSLASGHDVFYKYSHFTPGAVAAPGDGESQSRRALLQDDRVEAR